MNEPIAYSGIWILALIMIVLVSWYMYKYFSPKSWHEWAGADKGTSTSPDCV
jgi:hypothetical protein